MPSDAEDEAIVHLAHAIYHWFRRAARLALVGVGVAFIRCGGSGAEPIDDGEAAVRFVVVLCGITLAAYVVVATLQDP
jgi:hypothetical protein